MIEILDADQAHILQERLSAIQAGRSQTDCDQTREKIREIVDDMGLLSTHFLIQGEDYQLCPHPGTTFFVQAIPQLFDGHNSGAALIPIGYDCRLTEQNKVLQFRYGFQSKLSKPKTSIFLGLLPTNIVVCGPVEKDHDAVDMIEYDIPLEFSIEKNSDIKKTGFSIQCLDEFILQGSMPHIRQSWEACEKTPLGQQEVLSNLYATSSRDFETKLFDLWFHRTAAFSESFTSRVFICA